LFENRVLRKIFRPERDEVMGEWRKLHSGELHNLYSSPDIIRQIKSRRMRWAGHVACIGEGQKCIEFWWESLKEKDHLEDQGVDWRMGSKWTFGRLTGGGADWINLAEDGDRWRAVVNAVMNFRFLAPRC
jgi:hypothetical protein